MAKTSFKSVTYFPIKMKPWLRNPVKYENPARKVPATSKGWVKWHNCVEKNLLLCPHADHLITNPRQINLHMNTVSFKSVTYFSVKMKPWLRNPDYSFIMLLQFRLFLKICKFLKAVCWIYITKTFWDSRSALCYDCCFEVIFLSPVQYFFRDKHRKLPVK